MIRIQVNLLYAFVLVTTPTSRTPPGKLLYKNIIFWNNFERDMIQSCSSRDCLEHILWDEWNEINRSLVNLLHAFVLETTTRRSKGEGKLVFQNIIFRNNF